MITSDRKQDGSWRVREEDLASASYSHITAQLALCAED